MKNIPGLLAVIIASTVTFVSLPSIAAPPTSKKQTAKKAESPRYECPDCHKKFTVAQAKKDGMKCSCCQAKLVAIKTATTKKSKGPK